MHSLHKHKQIGQDIVVIAVVLFVVDLPYYEDPGTSIDYRTGRQCLLHGL